VEQYNDLMQLKRCCPYAHPPLEKHLRNSGRLLTPAKQNLDVLSTFCGRKYGRLDVIQNLECNQLAALCTALHNHICSNNNDVEGDDSMPGCCCVAVVGSS